MTMRGCRSDADDAQLVLSVRAGDLAAFDVLVRRYRNAATLIAWPIVGTRATAEDVAQDALLLAFKALPQLADPAKFAGWLAAITRQRAKRVATGEGRWTPTEPSKLDRMIMANSAPETSETVTAEKEEHLRVLTANLPDDYRLVLNLRYWEEWPLARIGQFLSLPVSTIKWRLHHGRDLLRRALTKAWEEESNE